MRLSELIKIRRSIDALDLEETVNAFDKSHLHLVSIINNLAYKADNTIQSITHSGIKISEEFDVIKNSISEYRKLIQQEIDKLQAGYYVRSEEIYYASRHDSVDYIFDRRKNSLTFRVESSKEIFLSRVSAYNDWRYPGAEIRPAFGEVTEIIKGCDPLYLIDTDEELFREIKNNWSQTYQRRLRYYTINETNNDMFYQLPDNQFGFIVSVDYFNFKPLNFLEKALKDLYNKLRPGGILMFTYNNCDMPYAVQNVEKEFCCFTPGHKVVAFAQDIGYEIISQVDDVENISWLELKKPGEITTLRGGQTLGEILSFSDRPK